MMYRIDIMKKIIAAAAASVLLASPAACFAEEAVPAAEPAPAVQPVDPAPAVQSADPAPAVQPADPAPAPAADAGGSGGGEVPASSADSGGETPAVPAEPIPAADGSGSGQADNSAVPQESSGTSAETSGGETSGGSASGGESSSKAEAEKKAAAAAWYYYYSRSSSSSAAVAADKGSSGRKVRKVLLTEETQQCLKGLNTLRVQTRTGTKDMPDRVEIIGDWAPSLREILLLQGRLRDTEKAGCHIGLVMLDIQSGRGIAINPERKFYSASSIKGPFVISLAAMYPQTLEKQETAFRAVAVNSDNGAYSGLVRLYGRKFFDAWRDAVDAEAPLTDGDYTTTSAEDLARLWLLDYQYITGNPTYGAEVGELFETPNQSAIKPVVGEKYKTQTKGGWIAERLRTTADAGIVYAGDDPYIVALISDYPSNMKKLEPYMELLEALHEKMIKNPL